MHESNLFRKSLGACTCAHSSHPHFDARPRKKAADNATTTTQQINSTIRKAKLKVHK